MNPENPVDPIRRKAIQQIQQRPANHIKLLVTISN